ncbi:MAG TPA: MlaD family protein [Puia sp.]|uniref:MlaD family protein n=1 Tax=Puia sp. TaxID=2045100 RepID=UPI002C1A0610|nr:MlaD family protein [Puia sp.]HVU97789.1 MlaD family protein [Puia sp.]
MKISNETKVGVMAVVALAALILGFNYLKGSALFQHTKKLYAKFDNVEGLDVSNPVQVNGLTIGNVTAINESDKDLSQGVVATITLKKDVRLPDNSIAMINSSLLGTSTITITKGYSNKFLENGDTIETKQKPNLLSQVQANIDPVIVKLAGTLTSLDSLVQVVGTMFDPRTKNNFSTIVANLAASSAELQKMLNDQTGALAQSLRNLSQFTANLNKSNEHISSTMDNVDKTTAHLAAAKIPEAVDGLNATIGDLKATIQKLNSSNGTVGLLLNDKRLYNSLESTTRSLNTLLDDFRVHPKRYVNISVFGKKDKTGPLMAPVIDSTSKPNK